MGAPRQAAKTQSSRGERQLGLKKADPFWNKEIQAMEAALTEEAQRSQQRSNQDSLEEEGTAVYEHLQSKKPKQPQETSFEANNHVFLRLEHPALVQGAQFVFELLDDQAPLAAENFRTLCTNTQGLTFQGSSIHKISKGGSGDGWYMRGGDITKHDGTGGKSIFGSNFVDEANPLSLDEGGMLATAGLAPDSNSSQFIVTLAPAPQLAAKGHVVFGRMISKNPIDLLELLGKVPCDSQGRPELPITVIASGNQASTIQPAAALQCYEEESELQVVRQEEILSAVRQKAKRSREDAAQAVTAVKHAVAHALKQPKKSKKDTTSEVVHGAGLEEEEEDLFANDF